MLGPNFFHTRAKLTMAVAGLSRLADETSVSQSKVNTLRNLVAGLKEPFIFTVVGEVNAGKSTLLNGLFGSEFCSADVVPTTDKICIFKHGAENHEVEVADTLVEIYRTNDFLQDFNIVDTPGVNSIELGHQQITERYIPMADVVIFVFSVTNPWSAATWDLLDRIHRKWLKKIVFVLQQIDLRDSEEVNAIVEHLRRTSRVRLGTEFPTFAMSAKKAYLSKTSGLDKERLWRESQFSEFQGYLSGVVDSSEARLAKLVNTCRAAMVVLEEIKGTLSTSSNVILLDRELLSGLEAATAQQEKRTRAKLEATVESLDADYMQNGIAASKKLDSRLALTSILRGPGRLPKQIEELLKTKTEESVAAKAREAASLVEDDVVGLWKRLAEETQRRFGFNLSVGESGEPVWDQQRDRMIERLRRTADIALSEFSVTAKLASMLHYRRVVLMSLGLLAVVAGLTGAILTSQGMSPANLVVLSLAGAAGLGGALYGVQSMNSISRRFASRMEEQRKTLHESLRAAMLDEVAHFMKNFVDVFAPLRKVCAEHREKHEPQLEKLTELETNLRDVEKALRPVENFLQENGEGSGPEAAEPLQSAAS